MINQIYENIRGGRRQGEGGRENTSDRVLKNRCRGEEQKTEIGDRTRARITIFFFDKRVESSDLQGSDSHTQKHQ